MSRCRVFFSTLVGWLNKMMQLDLHCWLVDWSVDLSVGRSVVWFFSFFDCIFDWMVDELGARFIWWLLSFFFVLFFSLQFVQNCSPFKRVLIAWVNENPAFTEMDISAGLMNCGDRSLDCSSLGDPELDSLNKKNPFCDFPLASRFSLLNKTIVNAVLWKLSKCQPF